MDGEKMRQLRKQAKLTQGEAAEALGITGAYWGELERGDKSIDRRLALRIDEALNTRIDVGYSEGLAGWTVSVTSVARSGVGQRPHRIHEVLACYSDESTARRRANDIKAMREPLARIVVRGPQSAPRVARPGQVSGAK